jgi:hypothetical protein
MEIIIGSEQSLVLKPEWVRLEKNGLLRSREAGFYSLGPVFDEVLVS